MFRSTKTISMMLLIAASLVFASCGKDSDDASSEVAARVGSKDITIKQVDSAIKRQLDAQGGAPLSPAELVAARLSVLDKLIQEEALYQKAQKDNLVPDDNKVNQEIERQKQDAGLTEEKYHEQLKRAAVSEQEWKDQVRKTLAINELYEKARGRVTAPTDAEIEKSYNENKEQFVARRGVEMSIIAADPADSGRNIDDAKSDTEAETKIKAIYEQLKSGSDFATIARNRSEDPSASQNGSVGFADEESLKQRFPTRPELVQRFMTMTAGQYTEPIKDNLSNRWFIFKINAKRDQPANLTLNDPQVQKAIVDGIKRQRQEILINALLLVAVQEANAKNYLAERIVNDPKTIVEMRPSALLESAQNPQQRIENENKAAPSSTTNSNSSANSNRK